MFPTFGSYVTRKLIASFSLYNVRYKNDLIKFKSQIKTDAASDLGLSLNVQLVFEASKRDRSDTTTAGTNNNVLYVKCNSGFCTNMLPLHSTSFDHIHTHIVIIKKCSRYESIKF